MAAGIVGGVVGVRFQLLGPVRAWSLGRGEPAELDLGPGRQRAVLAVLLLHGGEPVPAARLAEAAWGGTPPANRLDVLSEYAAALRRVLGPALAPPGGGQGEVLARSDAGYALAVPDRAVDARLFTATVAAADAALRAAQPDDAASLAGDALDLWHGEPFAGLGGPWFAAERARLAERRGSAVETWATAELELGNHERTVPELQRLVAELPVRQGPRELLMLALYRSGRRDEALAAYRDAREHLVAATGAEPGPGMQDLFERILRSDPGLAPPPAPAARPPEPGAPRSATPPRTEHPPAPGEPDGPGRRSFLGHVGGAIAILGPLVSFGLLTWAFVAFFAIRRRSGRLALAATAYLGLAIAALVVTPATGEAAPAWRTTATWLLYLTLIGGGVVHLAAIVHRPSLRRRNRSGRHDRPAT